VNEGRCNQLHQLDGQYRREAKSDILSERPACCSHTTSASLLASLTLYSIYIDNSMGATSSLPGTMEEASVTTTHPMKSVEEEPSSWGWLLRDSLWDMQLDGTHVLTLLVRSAQTVRCAILLHACPVFLCDAYV